MSGGADMVSVVIRQTLVQLDTPDAMRGRVSAVNSTFIGASNELGEFRAGTVAEWMGPIGAVVVGGAGTLVVAGTLVSRVSVARASGSAAAQDLTSIPVDRRAYHDVADCPD